MNDPKDSRGVPISAGIPPIVTWSAIFGVIMVFVIVGLVIYASPYGHVWPSIDSTKIKL
jgi:hypothetical protein